MEILAISDFHEEFYKKSIVPALPLAKIICIAGDLAVGSLIEKRLEELCHKYPHVIYVAGNHEYYYSSFEEIDNIRHELINRFTNLYWLRESAVTINGQRFLGTTLWFPCTKEACDPTNQLALSDFSAIQDFSPRRAGELHDRAINFLTANLLPTDVVVTHHIPSWDLLDPVFAHSTINQYFIGDTGDLIQKTQPKMWIYGHTHKRLCTKRLHNTLMICTPRGYPSEWDGNLSAEHFTVEIP